MSRAVCAMLTLIPMTARLAAQHPLQNAVDAVEVRYAMSQPVVSYTLRVDSSDLSGYDVTIRIRNARDTFRLAMAAHPSMTTGFGATVPRPARRRYGERPVARCDPVSPY